MKITIEMPDTTSCAFLNYIYGTSTGLSMGVKTIDTDDLESGEVLVCNPQPQTEKGGAE